MVLTLREEIGLITCIYCFCLLTIPVTIFTKCSPQNQIEVSKINHHNSANLETRKRLFIDSIDVLEALNQKSNNSEDLGFSYLMNLALEGFDGSQKNFPSQTSKKQIKHVWNKFEFNNGTILRSKSLKLPLKIDWRRKRVISKVQNQQNCGSCFALSVIETIESMVAIKSGKLPILSVQQMLDCNEYHMSCKGGDSCALLNWLQSTQTRLSRKDEYSSIVDDLVQCSFEDDKAFGIKVKDYSCNDFSNHEELVLLHLAHQGPLVAAINATPLSHYVNGIVQHNCDSQVKNLNHVVQIVGYDLTQDVPFYIVKNSWSEQWGIDGYLKIAIGSNVCGIANKISSIVIKTN